MPETFHSPQQVKVFILYLLEKIGYPLDYNDLATIVIRDGYVDYFDFVTYFHELLEAGHIRRIGGDDDDENSAKERPVDRDSYMVSDTGRMIAKGLADDLLSSTLLATRAPVFVAPAMNDGMWDNPATQANIAMLKARGIMVIEPASGELACGTEGKGRFPAPEAICG